jgi:Tol biopolymer transport system component
MGANDSVSWSPNGEKIAFSGGVPGTQRQPNIFVVSVTDNNVLRLTDSPASQSNLSWSPDGNNMVFQFSHNLNQLDLATINLENNKTKTLTFTAGNEHHPVWSPDGKEIAYLYFDSSSSSKASELWVINYESKISHKILDAEVAYSNIDWSPNGEWIAYIDTKIKNNCGDIYIIRPDGSEKLKIMELPSCASSLSWSPNGEFIAFTSKDVETDYWGIYILDIKEKSINKIYSEEKDVINAIDWAMP